LLARALTLRCPYCGGRPVLAHWFRLRTACGQCGRHLERGERDYFIGSMLFNLILGEMVFAVAFLIFLFVTWPQPPWDTIEWMAPLGAVLSPAVLFPFSKLTWLAADLMVRPDRPA
jgi:uncharacterized protein (DUF983 family)